MKNFTTRAKNKLKRITLSAIRKTRTAYFKLLGRDPDTGFKINTTHTFTSHGSEYGNWNVPNGMIDSSSVCYCIGAGDDITFDIALNEVYGAEVHTFDPTPKAIEHFNSLDEDRVTYHPIGVWSEDKTMKFFAPKKKEYISHAITQTQNSDEYFEATCKTVKTIMDELGHTKVDLLKMDIEGAEYEVVASILRDKLDIPILCVEFDELYFNDLKSHHNIRRTIKNLLKAGYTFEKKDGQDYIFIISHA